MMMKKATLLATLLAGVYAAPALAGFSGPTDPAAFAVEHVGTLTDPTVLSQALFGADQLVLVGANSTGGCTGGTYGDLASPCQVQVTIALPGIYSFSWSYVSADADGPAGDIFGVIVDGTRIAVSDPGASFVQAGSKTYTATASFGWLLNCTDCTGAFATATVSSLSLAPIPEPATVALMLAGVAGIGAARRWRK